jgi:hypothetical protein
LQSVLSARCEIGFDVVQLAEAPGKLDMSLVIESGATEDHNAVLCDSIIV